MISYLLSIDDPDQEQKKLLSKEFFNYNNVLLFDCKIEICDEFFKVESVDHIYNLKSIEENDDNK